MDDPLVLGHRLRHTGHSVIEQIGIRNAQFARVLGI